MPEPILEVVTQDGKIVDLLEDWELSDPYWRPQIAKYKGDGNYVDSAIADGSRLVSKHYANVIETIPLTAKGTNQAQAIRRIRELLQVGRQTADYWTESYEYDYGWLGVRPACNDCQTGYARIIKVNIPELNNPFGQPFFSYQAEAVMEDLTLIIEREPLWRGVRPGTLIGPLYNVIKNPDFELWNFGIVNSQPDNWSDLETDSITGTNNQADDRRSGSYALKVQVTQSTAINRIKGVSQVVASIKPNSTYTIVAWVRNDGISSGVGRILVTYSSQLELYRSSAKHGWQLYTGTFTTEATDTVAISLEILTTAANTVGAVYFDSLMLLEGDWEEEAISGMLPYMSSSHIVNHWDQVGSTLVEAGDLNYIDMWDVPGDESALVKLEMVNNTPDSGANSPVVLEKVRVGMRRARDVTQFTNFYDPPGVSDTTASGDNRVNSGTLGTDWATVGFFTIDDAGIIQHNLGRFRVLVRVWDASTSGAFNLEVRLRYWIGQANINTKALDSVIVPGRGSWYIMDLTGNAALNWDIKGKNLPGSLGFEIQMKRASGTEQGRLDYAMVLPTDGGLLFANVSPSVPLNSGLVVDNTNSSDVYGARLARGWRTVYQISFSGTGGLQTLKSFNGVLYIGTAQQYLHKFQNNGGALIQQYNTSLGGDSLGLETFNGKLYVLARRSAGLPAEGFATDGITFPGTIEFTFGGNGSQPWYARAYQGYLYIAGIDGASNFATVWRWDGVSATATAIITRSDLAVNSEVTYIGIYKSKLYFHIDVDGGSNQVMVYDPATGSYSHSNTGSGAGNTYTNALVEFKGLLWWMQGRADSRIYSFDGVTWTQILLNISSGISWQAAVVVGDRLYIAGRRITSPTIFVLSTTDGETWRTEFSTSASTAASMEMITHQGQIFLAVYNNLYAVTFAENQYKVADYQLSEFRAPNREWGDQRRHRYFFSYDRENGVNVQDDAMLVGIGVVPRYLSLVGSN